MKTKILNFFLVFMGIVILFAAITIRMNTKTGMANTADGYPAPNAVVSLTVTLTSCDRAKAENDSRPPNSKSGMSEEDYRKCLASLTDVPKIKVTKVINTPIPTQPYKETRLRRIAGDGILIYGVLGRISPTSFIQTNAWYEMVGDRIIFVFGGIARDASPDSTRSAIAIDMSDLSGDWLPGGGIYEAPIRAGELTIVDAKGSLLTLVASNGDILLFDVVSTKFIIPDTKTKESLKKRQIPSGTIIEDDNSPFINSYKVTNHWFRDANGKRLSVFSARPSNDPKKAVILVTDTVEEPASIDRPDVFYVPGYNASEWDTLRIFSVDQDKVILTGKFSEFVFDLSSKKFLSESEIAQMPVDQELEKKEATIQKARIDFTNSANRQNKTITPTLSAYP